MLSKLAQLPEFDYIVNTISSTLKDTGGVTLESMLPLIQKTFNLLVAYLDADVSRWFADLCGFTIEQYDAMPFDVDLEVIEHLKQSGEITGFFTRALQLYKGIK